MNNIKHIFFDLDHTLWHFEKNSSLNFQVFVKKYNINVGLQSFLKFTCQSTSHYGIFIETIKLLKEYLRHNRLKSTFDKLNINS